MIPFKMNSLPSIGSHDVGDFVMKSSSNQITVPLSSSGSAASAALRIGGKTAIFVSSCVQYFIALTWHQPPSGFALGCILLSHSPPASCPTSRVTWYTSFAASVYALFWFSVSYDCEHVGLRPSAETQPREAGRRAVVWIVGVVVDSVVYANSFPASPVAGSRIAVVEPGRAADADATSVRATNPSKLVDDDGIVRVRCVCAASSAARLAHYS